MSRESYFARYVSPNIVIVPTVSFSPPRPEETADPITNSLSNCEIVKDISEPSPSSSDPNQSKQNLKDVVVNTNTSSETIASTGTSDTKNLPSKKPNTILTETPSTIMSQSIKELPSSSYKSRNNLVDLTGFNIHKKDRESSLPRQKDKLNRYIDNLDKLIEQDKIKHDKTKQNKKENSDYSDTDSETKSKSNKDSSKTERRMDDRYGGNIKDTSNSESKQSFVDMEDKMKKYFRHLWKRNVEKLKENSDREKREKERNSKELKVNSDKEKRARETFVQKLKDNSDREKRAGERNIQKLKKISDKEKRARERKVKKLKENLDKEDRDTDLKKNNKTRLNYRDSKEDSSRNKEKLRRVSTSSPVKISKHKEASSKIRSPQYSSRSKSEIKPYRLTESKRSTRDREESLSPASLKRYSNFQRFIKQNGDDNIKYKTGIHKKSDEALVKKEPIKTIELPKNNSEHTQKVVDHKLSVKSNLNSRINTNLKSFVQVNKNVPYYNSQIEDLRSRLSRKRTRSECVTNSKQMTQNKLDGEGLVITVQQNTKTDPKASTKSVQNLNKPKTNKCKKIKLVINIQCQNSVSDDSDENDDGRSSTSPHDLSFLDDFNVDEIVDSLNTSHIRLDNSKVNATVNITNENDKKVRTDRDSKSEERVTNNDLSSKINRIKKEKTGTSERQMITNSDTVNATGLFYGVNKTNENFKNVITDRDSKSKEKIIDSLNTCQSLVEKSKVNATDLSDRVNKTNENNKKVRTDRESKSKERLIINDLNSTTNKIKKETSTSEKQVIIINSNTVNETELSDHVNKPKENDKKVRTDREVKCKDKQIIKSPKTNKIKKEETGTAEEQVIIINSDTEDETSFLKIGSASEHEPKIYKHDRTEKSYEKTTQEEPMDLCVDSDDSVEIVEEIIDIINENKNFKTKEFLPTRNVKLSESKKNEGNTCRLSTRINRPRTAIQKPKIVNNKIKQKVDVTKHIKSLQTSNTNTKKSAVLVGKHVDSTKTKITTVKNAFEGKVTKILEPLLITDTNANEAKVHIQKSNDPIEISLESIFNNTDAKKTNRTICSEELNESDKHIIKENLSIRRSVDPTEASLETMFNDSHIKQQDKIEDIKQAHAAGQVIKCEVEIVDIFENVQQTIEVTTTYAGIDQSPNINEIEFKQSNTDDKVSIEVEPQKFQNSKAAEQTLQETTENSTEKKNSIKKSDQIVKEIGTKNFNNQIDIIPSTKALKTPINITENKTYNNVVTRPCKAPDKNIEKSSLNTENVPKKTTTKKDDVETKAVHNVRKDFRNTPKKQQTISENVTKKLEATKHDVEHKVVGQNNGPKNQETSKGTLKQSLDIVHAEKKTDIQKNNNLSEISKGSMNKTLETINKIEKKADIKINTVHTKSPDKTVKVNVGTLRKSPDKVKKSLETPINNTKEKSNIKTDISLLNKSENINEQAEKHKQKSNTTNNHNEATSDAGKKTYIQKETIEIEPPQKSEVTLENPLETIDNILKQVKNVKSSTNSDIKEGKDTCSKSEATIDKPLPTHKTEELSIANDKQFIEMKSLTEENQVKLQETMKNGQKPEIVNKTKDATINNDKTDSELNKCVVTASKVEVNLSQSLQRQSFVEKLEAQMLQNFDKKYTVTSLVHNGRFSVIYKCKDVKGEMYAIKALNSIRLKAKGFFMERMFAKLHKYRSNGNSCVLRIMSCFVVQGLWCFMTEYFTRNLKQALEENNRGFHIDSVQLLARQLVDAVNMLTNNDIIHSDIKPTHILLNSDNRRLKLCGFDRANYGRTIKVIPSTGTPSYRAPEIILGFSEDHRIDVWSMALVMFEMTTSTQLFPGQYNNDILYKQLCTLGSFDWSMVENSRHRDLYFVGTSFLRQMGAKGQESVLVHVLQRNNKLRNQLFSSYNDHWAPYRSNWQVTEDLDKIESLHELLKQMLVLDPRHRLPIQFVDASEFIYDNFA